MPNVRKFSPDEVQALEDKGKGARKLLIERMDRAFAEFAVGDYGELRTEDGETALIARLRLKAAARRRGLKVVFLRRRGDTKLFRVEVAPPTASRRKRATPLPATPPPPPSPAPRGRGRPKTPRA